VNKLDRRLADIIYHNSFGAFCCASFRILNPGVELNPNWHIDFLCHSIQNLAANQTGGRLVINLPPRSLKSFIISVCLPAWLLGRNPSARILCASYSEELAFKFSRGTRALMESSFYQKIFPRTKFNPRKTTERELETTRHGYRLATSVGGTLTGRGGDTLIVDDPIKAIDGESERALGDASDWFRNTALSRLDKIVSSLILVTMQRLHADDLSGILIDQGWPSLVLPAIATETVEYELGEGEIYCRPAGEPLQPDRDTPEGMEAQRASIGSKIFSAQYQQNPVPADGNMIKSDWLRRYDFVPGERWFGRVVLSCDPAGKAGQHNDYTSIAIFGFNDKYVHVLHVVRGHWTVMQMHDRIKALAVEWRVDQILIEDTASGMGLLQILRHDRSLSAIGRRPTVSKVVRMAQHEGRFEAGLVLLPKEAIWLADFEDELLAFPSGRYDDQVDAVLLFLDWFAQADRLPTYGVALPVYGSDDSSY
jgi:predicted phage terminase large subunit-like protein